MRTSNRSGFLPWSTSNGVTSRTAVYGPVCTVVWQGSAGDRRPYADQCEISGAQVHKSDVSIRAAQRSGVCRLSSESGDAGARPLRFGLMP